MTVSSHTQTGNQHAAFSASSWTPHDRALLECVDSALTKAGLPVETTGADTEGGDPWAVFSRVGSGDVLIHVSLVDGVYTIASEMTGVLLQGRSFEAIARQFLRSEPTFILEANHPGALILHSGSALISIFAAMCIMAEDMELVACGERADRMGGSARPATALVHIAENAHLSIGRYTFDRQETAAIMSAVGFASANINSAAMSVPAETVDLDIDQAPVSISQAGVTVSFDTTGGAMAIMRKADNDDGDLLRTIITTDGIDNRVA